MVRDAPYRSMREAILPVAYVPFAGDVRAASFVVRTKGSNPNALASTLRREVPAAHPELRVSNIRSQEELVRAQTVRERLVAMLALFFAGVALLLAGIGLYGVLDYSVLQRRREIGIRMAIGAQPADIARRVTAEVFRMVAAGACIGVLLGIISVRYLESLLYGVRGRDWGNAGRACAGDCGSGLSGSGSRRSAGRAHRSSRRPARRLTFWAAIRGCSRLSAGARGHRILPGFSRHVCTT